MKKKLATLLVLSAIGILIIGTFAKKQHLYSDICISQTQMHSILKNRTMSESPLCSRISFNEYDLVYDADNNRFFYSLILDDGSSYNPCIEYVSSQKNVNIAIVGGSINDEIISNGTEYTIIFYTEKLYETYSLAFTTLPLLSISYEGELQGVDKKDLELRLFDNRKEAAHRVINSIGEIHYRGNYSRKYPKVGYRITLQEYSLGNNRREQNISLLGLRQDGDWLLYAGYNDQEKIRNVFSSNLWKESCATNNICGIDNGMEYRYVELFVNGTYHGLYALGYPIDSLQLQLDAGEYTYEKTNANQSEPSIDFNATGAVASYAIKEYGINQQESWEPLKKYYKAMFYNGNDYTELQKYSDITNCIDIFLFLNLIQGVDHANLRDDNTIYNLYMTNKFCDDNQREVILYTPWDMDRTWGNGFSDAIYNVSADQNVIMQSNIVYLLLAQGDLEIRNQVSKRYNELRKGSWSNEHIMEILSLYERQIFDSGAYVRDKDRWPNGNYISEADKLNTFKEYVAERLKYMDLFMQQYE